MPRRARRRARRADQGNCGIDRPRVPGRVLCTVAQGTTLTSHTTRASIPWTHGAPDMPWLHTCTRWTCPISARDARPHGGIQHTHTTSYGCTVSDCTKAATTTHHRAPRFSLARPPRGIHPSRVRARICARPPIHHQLTARISGRVGVGCSTGSGVILLVRRRTRRFITHSAGWRSSRGASRRARPLATSATSAPGSSAPIRAATSAARRRAASRRARRSPSGGG